MNNMPREPGAPYGLPSSIGRRQGVDTESWPLRAGRVQEAVAGQPQPKFVVDRASHHDPVAGETCGSEESPAPGRRSSVEAGPIRNPVEAAPPQCR